MSLFGGDSWVARESNGNDKGGAAIGDLTKVGGGGPALFVLIIISGGDMQGLLELVTVADGVPLGDDVADGV